MKAMPSSSIPEHVPDDRRDLGGLRTLMGRVVFGVAAFLLYVVAEFWIQFGKPWEPTASAVIALALFAVHVVLVRRRVGAMDPSIWLPVCFLMFYFGVPISMGLIFEIPPPEGMNPWSSEIGPPINLARGYCLALLTMVSFIWGLHLAGSRDLSKGPDGSAPADESYVLPAYILAWGALAMLAIAVAIIGPSVVFGIYSEWWAAKLEGRADARWVDIGIVFAASGAFALLASSGPKNRVRVVIAVSIIVLLSIVNIQKGARGPLVTTALGAGWCYTQRIRRLSWTPVLAVAISMLVILPALVEWRAYRSIEESSGTSVRDLVGSAFYGMGGTASVFPYVLDFVPRDRGFAWGASFWQAFVQSIPNLSLTPGASFKEVDPLDIPSNWISSKVAPTWYNNGGGFGFAMGAEFYYNFGITGVLICATLLGYFVGRVRNASGVSALKLVASALLFGNVASFTRDLLGTPMKGFLWPIVGLVILRAITSVVFPRPRPRDADAAENPTGAARVTSVTHRT